MSTKSRQTLYGGPIMGAEIRAEGAGKRAADGAREADGAEAREILPYKWVLHPDEVKAPFSTPVLRAARATLRVSA